MPPICRNTLEHKMSGQELLPDEPTSPVIPSRRTNLALLTTRVEILERGMAELMKEQLGLSREETFSHIVNSAELAWRAVHQTGAVETDDSPISLYQLLLL